MITNSSSIWYLFRVQIFGKYTNKNEYTNTKNDQAYLPQLSNLKFLCCLEHTMPTQRSHFGPIVNLVKNTH